MIRKNLDFLRDAGSKADFLDTADFNDIMDQVQSDVAHLEAGAAMWAKRLAVEKLCGMTHTEEINGWLARQRGREPPP